MKEWLKRIVILCVGILFVSGFAGCKDEVKAPAKEDDGPLITEELPMMFGVNLAGGEFGSKVPGTYAQDYIYPNPDEFDYYHSKGLNLIRIPFKWERIQRELFGPLHALEMHRLDQVFGYAAERGMKVIPDVHNYGRYNDIIIGTGNVSYAGFKDFWRKLADHWKDEEAIWAYGIMNEPHDMDGHWPAGAQAAVDGIREVDMNHYILIPGDGWSGAHSWLNHSADLDVEDPADRYLFEAHQYFDNDHSGTYNQNFDGEGADLNTGVDRVRDWVDWLQQRGKKGFMGEYGVPDNDSRWNMVLENFLNYLNETDIVSGTYWAGGPWWGDYPLCCEPEDGKDARQMSVLEKYPGNGAVTE